MLKHFVHMPLSDNFSLPI